MRVHTHHQITVRSEQKALVEHRTRAGENVERAANGFSLTVHSLGLCCERRRGRLGNFQTCSWGPTSGQDFTSKVFGATELFG